MAIFQNWYYDVAATVADASSTTSGHVKAPVEAVTGFDDQELQVVFATVARADECEHTAGSG